MWHRAMVRLVSLGCLLLIAGCSLPQAQNTRLLKAWTAKCKEASDLLATVKDAPSAKAASPKIIKLMKELDKLNEQLDESYDPSDVSLVEMPGTTKHLGEGIGEMQRLMQESVRIGQDRELRAALGEAWQYLPAAPLVDAEGNLIQG